MSEHTPQFRTDQTVTADDMRAEILEHLDAHGLRLAVNPDLSRCHDTDDVLDELTRAAMNHLARDRRPRAEWRKVPAAIVHVVNVFTSNVVPA